MNKKLILILLILIVIGCKSSDDKLKDSITEIDRLLKNDSINLPETLKQFDLLNDALNNSTKRRKEKPDIPEAAFYDYDVNANYKWNTDSSVNVIKTSVRVKGSIEVNGITVFKDHTIKHETLINLSDTAIFYYVFHVWYDETRRNTITRNESPGYIFIEDICYLTNKGPIKIWSKIDYNSTSLSDTAIFKNSPSIDRTSRGGSFGQMLYHARNIFAEY